MRGWIVVLMLLTTVSRAQEAVPDEGKGSAVRTFTVTLADNSSKSINLPWQNRLTLLRIWKPGMEGNHRRHAQLRSISERYKKAWYKTADGFEIVTLAVGNDRKQWKDLLTADSMSSFLNGQVMEPQNGAGFAGFQPDSYPYEVLMDEKGTVLAVNPDAKALEGLLADRKIFQPAKRTLTGTLAQSLNRDEAFRNGKVILLTAYGDTLAKCTSLGNGKFVLPEVKLNQDLVLRLPGQKDMDPQAPLALYNAEGAYLMNGTADRGECVFFIPHQTLSQLLDRQAASGPTEQLLVLHNFEFSTSDGFQLSRQDEKELDNLVNILMKVKSMSIEFKVHTDAKLNDAGSMDLATRQAQLIKNYLIKKGVTASRIKAIPKGRSLPLSPCKEPDNCSEDEHRQNRRVEFVIA